MMTIIYVVGALLLGILLLKIKAAFIESLKLSALAYLYAWIIYYLLYLSVVFMTYLLKFVGITIDWDNSISDSKWIIQGVIFFIFIMAFLSDSDSSGKRVKATNSKKSSKAKATVIPIPVQKSDRKPETVTHSSRNITNLSNDVRNGIDIAISFQSYNTFDIERLAILAYQSGAKITLKDISKVQVETLTKITKVGRGHVYIDRIIEAGFDAEKLAKHGACFVCDCKNRSTSIINIAKYAVEGRGKVTLINCKWMSSREILELRTVGKDFIEIR